MLPVGVIIMWSGAIVDIPFGYVLCDGNNGTPDLRDKFIVGAGDTYAVDATGGTINHNHQFFGDGHVHELQPGTSIASGTGFDEELTPGASVGTTNNAGTLPPYHALAFIMKT